MSKKSANKKVAPAKPSGTIANKLTTEDDGIQLSVAFSDSLLATTSAFSVFILSQKADTFYENISFGLLAIAATLGVIRFGVLPQISTIHKFFATLAGFSIAILAWGIYTRIDQTIGILSFYYRRKCSKLNFPCEERDARLMAIGVILLIVVIPCTFLGLAKFIEVFQTAGKFQFDVKLIISPF